MSSIDTMDITNKILNAVSRLNLDLTGKIVLTEAATGAYIVTPVIAAAAGAEVFAFTRSTRYGSVNEVKKQTNELSSRFKNNRFQINIIDQLSPEIIGKADIITNSGHLRPLNNEKLKFAKKGTVVPLMYEGWEWRDSDLDLAFCKINEITVAATNERHPEIDVFNYLGDMALKMIFDAGLCPYNNRFVLICNNDFGPFIAKVLCRVCSGLAICDTEVNKIKYEGLPIEWIGDFPDFKSPERFKKSEAVIFTGYPFDKQWIGKENFLISVYKIRDEFPEAVLLRYAGDIDETYCKDKILFYPEFVHSGHMGILPSAIGNDPIIRLQSGGLKVGELALKRESHYNGIKMVDYL
jgi:hypothetical protein